MNGGLVSVVIPAYNAISTLDDTLNSARSQTYHNLEIIVVDDGSTDATTDVVHRHAAEDPRVRLIHQNHRGHSAARNRGIQAAAADLIATLDADDLWRPTKIAKQVEALRAGGDRVGLVYTWFALIDEKGRVRSTGHRSMVRGDALRDCCNRNPIGNGSSALMRKSVILEAGGFDENLTGCEDLKLYIAIAERHHFEVVAEHLTGYRQSNRNVTSDVMKMRHAADRVLCELQQRHAKYTSELDELRRSLYDWLYSRALAAGRIRDAISMFRALRSIDPPLALRATLAAPRRALKRAWQLTGVPLLSGFLRQPSGFSLPRFLPEQRSR